MRSTLQTSYALVAFLDAKSSDDAIEKALSNVPTPELRHLRQEEMAQWRREHDPAGVAARHLPGCLSIAAIPLAPSAVPGSIVRACLKQTEPATLLTIYRLGNKPLPEALQVVSARYSPPVLPPDPRELAQKIYGAPPGSDALPLREEIFDNCLQATLTRSGRH